MALHRPVRVEALPMMLGRHSKAPIASAITFVRVGNVGARLLKLGDEIVEDLAVSLEDVHGASEASAALRCVQTHLLVHLRERRQHVRDVTLKGNCRVLLATFEEWCRL